VFALCSEAVKIQFIFGQGHPLDGTCVQSFCSQHRCDPERRLITRRMLLEHLISRRQSTGVPRLQETATPLVPIVGPCLGSYCGPRGAAVSYEQGTPASLKEEEIEENEGRLATPSSQTHAVRCRANSAQIRQTRLEGESSMIL
jgi:hypothetical protein